MIWSMIANIGAYVAVSLSGTQSADEQRQASLFVDVFRQSGEAGGARFWRGTASVPDLYSLLARFLGARCGRRRVRRLRARRAACAGRTRHSSPTPSSCTTSKCSSPARSARPRRASWSASVVKEEALTIDEVREILDEASQVVVYSHRLEQKSRELEAATAELRAANERLKELDRLKDDFVSTVTHELRTPLTSIRAFSEILLDDPDLELPSAQEVPRHHHQGNRAPDAPDQPDARPVQDRVGRRRMAGIAQVDMKEMVADTRRGDEPAVQGEEHPDRGATCPSACRR